MIVQKVVILIFRDGDIPWLFNLKVDDDARYNFLMLHTIVFFTPCERLCSIAEANFTFAAI